MSCGEYPEEFIKKCKAVTKKRPRTIINHLLKYGSITTAEIEELYGYAHAPRAIRDVKEAGIPIKKKMIVSDGKRMAQYSFGDPSEVGKFSQKTGRTSFASDMKPRLLERYGSRDNIYLEEVPEAELQIDHRIPYEIFGEGDESEGEERFQLLTASANRLKSHTCENCSNWKRRDPEYCRTCFWAYPESTPMWLIGKSGYSMLY